MTSTVFVSVRLEHPKYGKEFAETAARQHANVAECDYIAGDVDYLLKVVTDTSQKPGGAFIRISRRCARRGLDQDPVRAIDHQKRRVGPARSDLIPGGYFLSDAVSP